MKKSIVIVVASIIFCLQSAYSQITTNELPISVQRGLGLATKDKTTGAIDLPVPDIKKLLQEDSLSQEMNPNGSQRTAVSIPVIIDINKDGIWSTLEDGGRLWQMEIHAEKALALDFVFSKFWLPKGGKFFLFNPMTKETIGAITSRYILGEKNNPHRFSTGILRGDKIILEYYQPAEEEGFPVINVEKAYYTYIPVPNFLSPSTCSYEVNVNCSEGNGWQLEKNAIALVYFKNGFDGKWGCGSLINNTQNDLAPLFLTANHCVNPKDAIDDNDLSDYVFYWGYELESCSSTTQPYYTNKTTIGATLIANNSYSDFALLELQQDPLDVPGYIPYYLGWDVSGNSGTGGVCIHHPNHDVKKISTYSCTPATVSYNSSPAVYWAVSWIATTNGHGITEAGSSGSPLINSNYRVIGQLKGASTALNCSNLTGGTSVYGKLSVSWTGNGNNDNRRRLNYWLNPNGTNVQSINGLYPYNLSGPSYICSSSTDTYTINNLPSNYTVSWYFSDGFGPTAPTIQSSGFTCTITNNLSKTFQGTLNAAIYYNGLLLTTLKKENIIVYGGFYGLCGNGSALNQEFYPNTPIWVAKGSTIHLKSPNFVNKNISYSVTTPSSWQYDSTTGNLYVTYPNVTPNNPIIINVQNDTSYSSCDNSCQIIIMPNNVLPPYSLNVSTNRNGQIYVTLVNTEYGDEARTYRGGFTENITQIEAWTLEVYNAKTSKKVFDKKICGTRYTIDTTCWEPNIYIIKVIVGGETLSEKVIVK